MTIPCAIPFRRALLLACTALAALQYQCHAFCPSSLIEDVRLKSPQQFLSSKISIAASTTRPVRLSGKATDDEEDRSRPNIVVIKTHQDYIKFLDEDDRLCVIKFYASWCKSCARFGKRYRHLAFDEGDRINFEGSIYHSGKVRFAEVEYTASAKLCKSLKVRRLPTVHMYRKGKGKIADMTCKPSEFHFVVDEMHRLLDDSGGVESSPEMEAGKEIQMEKVHHVHGVGGNGNVTSTSFDSLGDEIMASLGGKEESKKEKKPWLPFL